jgi:hypothetical protein
VLAGLAVLALAGSASAQGRVGSSSGSSMGSTGGFTGGSSGSFGSSSSFGTFGSSGSSTFGSGTGTGGGGRGGAATYGQSAPYGSFFANPLALGVASTGTGATASSSSGSRYVRAFPVQLTFGQPLYSTTSSGTATVSRGTTGGLGGGTGQISTSPYAGASSGSTRRAPSYITELALDQPAPRPSMARVRSELQGIISGASSLPSAGNIRVSVNSNGLVVLRGQVGTARERRLAENMLRLTPGVTRVRNDLRVAR